MSRILLLPLLAFALVAPTVHAATVQKCMDTAKKSKKTCEDKAKDAVAKSQQNGKKVAPGAVGAKQQADALAAAA